MGTENKYDFVIADINGRFNSLLKAKEYKILTKCKSLDELIIKLNHYIPFINEDMDSSISELKSRLYKSIHCELEDFKDCDLVALDCFKDYNLIHSFFTILETGHQKPEANYIDEYKCLLTYKSFKDIENLCIKGFRIEKFFEGVSIEDKIEDNNLQKMYCQVQKNFFDYYYNLAEGYLLEILETEADRQIIEICINNKEFRERRNLFPKHSRISEAAKDRLCGDTNIKTILNINSGDPIRNCVIKQAKMYAESFRQYGDTSCIYSYFRLKELEARNILWIAECILQKNREHINEYITFE